MTITDSGTVSRWGSRGYGFIEYPGGSIYAHISDFKDQTRVPAVGDSVQFIVGSCAGKTRAMAITFTGDDYNNENLPQERKS